MALLDELNPAQKEAVLSTEGPLLVLAGAGAGKTKTITARIAHLIAQGVAPSEILAVTFTNKAAKEMRERVMTTIADRALGVGSERPMVATFHGLGVHIIKEHAGLLGLPRHFSIFDRSDATRAVKEALVRAGIDPKRFEPKKILGAISRAKGEGLSQSEYAEQASDYVARMVADAWQHYDAILKKENALDFDDLLVRAYRLLRNNESVRAHYHKTWRYIHIDEYQDTNAVQFEISKLLMGPKRNICVVGDIDQNIYSWRGADVGNLLSFEEAFPGAKTVVLEENYRSTQTILEASNAIIEKNVRRKEKTLFTKNDAGEPLSLYSAYDEGDEARFIAQTAAELIARGTSPRDIAVLYRANFQSRVIEEAFLYAGIPYQVLGTRFFERKEVKDVLSFLRAALNPESTSDVSRVVGVPPRGIGKVTLLAMLAGREQELAPAAQKKIAEFKDILARIRESIETNKPSETVRFALEISGLRAHLERGGEDELERLENIKELATLASKYDALAPLSGIEQLLEDAALASDQDSLIKDEKAVKLMTVHASKGLEFDAVFIAGLEEGLFPHESMANDEARDDEEERRLFYVALTRARKKIFLSHASVRTIFGSREVTVPSQFLSDLDPRYVETLDAYGGDTGEPTITIE